jgi:hypothetical protein
MGYINDVKVIILNLDVNLPTEKPQTLNTGLGYREIKG